MRIIKRNIYKDNGNQKNEEKKENLEEKKMRRVIKLKKKEHLEELG